jgi:2-polyprenyl-3-methyl-5-hydroxy-6-metoxy-1,4-benzoquinol methylase
LPADEQFDAATLIEVLEHIPPEKGAALAKRISSCLRPHGFLVVTVPTIKARRVNPRHYRHFDRATLSAILSESFEMQHVYFLSKVSFLDRLTGLLLHNRLFILNEARLTTALYSYYVEHLLETDEASAGRLLAVFAKR